jgi:anthranilate 1,2-dioxygenase small subunit
MIAATERVSAPDVLARLDELQVEYVRALDDRDLAAWLACFRADGSYTCIARENEEQGLPMPLMLDDCGERLRDRVKFITEVWSGTYEDYRTRHFTQRLRCVREAPDVYLVTSNVLVLYTTPAGASEVLVSGTYEDRIVVDGGVAAFASKRAVLDTDVTPRYLVYPI